MKPPDGAADAAALAELKARHHTTISVCLPARDEEATVGQIVASVRRNLMERVALVDEIVVIDDGSTDATADTAIWEGAAVHSVSELLASTGAGSGKGNAMWLSLYAVTGDIVCWCDADVRNFHPEFVTTLVGPLLAEPDVSLVKGYYRRPLFGRPSGGGRVTELVARPLLSALFPQLAHIVQPLGGEYAGRRSVL
jgi:glucosyl-3-phosphoglycerate synthase